MANLTGKELAKFAKSKLGTPYVYGAKGRDGKFTQIRLNSLARSYPSVFTSSYLNKIKKKGLVGKVCCDCSGLIDWYTHKGLGSYQLYSTAYARIPISNWKKFAVGTVVWKQGHVGVYIGNGKVVEEKGIDYGCIESDITDTSWKYGLTFSYIDYDIGDSDKIESSEITYKGKNPYKNNKPTRTLKKGCKGDDIKWLQWELNQAGFNLTIDGIFGTNTLNAVKKFKKSAKISPVSGAVGGRMVKALVNDK